MSYIKPLNGSIGPKSAKCELKDETVHVDFDDWTAMLTTTRTPEVPSGGAFSIKTRTCITWAGATSTKIVVTSGVEWTGRSFIKCMYTSILSVLYSPTKEITIDYSHHREKRH